MLLTSACILTVTSVIFAQSISQDKQNLKLISIVSQPDCPLILTPAGIDDSNERITILKFTVQNFSSKTIKAYTISRNPSEPAVKNVQTFFAPLSAGQAVENSDAEAKINLGSDSRVYFLVDYILFDDGSWWGKNSRQEAEFIAGFYEGQNKSFFEVNKLLNTLGETELLKLLQQENIKIDGVRTLKDKSEKWKDGFLAGYRLVLNELKGIYKNLGLQGLPLNVQNFNELIKPTAHGV
jgi:hypothetical protein